MSYWLKQSTAVTVKMGPFLDSTDGDTEETGLTIAQADIRLSKNGGNIAQTNNVAGATHDEKSMYGVPLDTTDTNTLGSLKALIHVSGALFVWETFMVVSANVYDSKFSTDKLQVDVTQWNGTAVATPDTAGFPKITIKDGTGAGEIALTGGKVDGVALVDTTTTNTDMVSEPPTAVQNRQEMDSNSTELAKIGTIPALDGAAQEIGAAIGKLADDNGGADYDAALHSSKAIIDRGDAAWITGGGGVSDIINFNPQIPISIDLANTATVRLGIMLINSVDDLPSTAEITPGTISIDRKAIGGTSWSNVVSDSAMSEIAGLVYFDEVFDSGTGYAAGDSIRITFKSVKITVAANDYEIMGATGRIFQTYIREAMRGTEDAALATGVQLSAQGKLDVNEQVDGALDTPIPESPTAKSINDRVFNTLRYARNTKMAVHHGAISSMRALSEDYFLDYVNGNDGNNGLEPDTAKLTYAAAKALTTAYNHDGIVIVNSTGAAQTIDTKLNNDVPTNHITGPGRSVTIKPTSTGASTIILSADFTHIEGLSVETDTSGNESAVEVTADKCTVHRLDVPQSRGSGILLTNTSNSEISEVNLVGPGFGGNGHGILITGTSTNNDLHSLSIEGAAADGIRLTGAGVLNNVIRAGQGGSLVHDNTGWGIQETGGADQNHFSGPGIVLGHNTLGNYSVSPNTVVLNVDQFLTQMHYIISTGTAQDGAGGNITLADTESGLDNFLNGARIFLFEGTGAGQSRLIVDYNGTSKVATISPNWLTTPDSTTKYVTHPATGAKDFDISGIVAKLPTNFIMGSSDQTDQDDNIAAIKSDTAATLADTAEMQPKLPTNNIMGSGVKTDLDDEILAIKAKTDNMPEGIPKNQAYNDFHFFMADVADNITGKTGLAITSQRAIDGGSFAATTNSATEISLGFYKINLSAADLNGDTISFVFSGGVTANDREITIKTQT